MSEGSAMPGPFRREKVLRKNTIELIMLRKENAELKSQLATALVEADKVREAGNKALGGKTPWKFACDWYKAEDIWRSIARSRTGKEIAPGGVVVPEDVYSNEFAGWLTDQYRLAMNKGIEIGLRAALGR